MYSYTLLLECVETRILKHKTGIRLIGSYLFSLSRPFFIKLVIILQTLGFKRLRIGMGIHLTKAATFVALALAVSVNVSAKSVEEKSDSPFAGLDSVIEDLMDTKEQPNILALPPSLILTETEALVNRKPVIGKIIQTEPPKEDDLLKAKGLFNEPSKAPAVEPPAQKINDSVLTTRLKDVPPGTLFEFTTDLFIPANKGGYVFVDGAPKYTFDVGADINGDVLNKSLDGSVCVLSSNKSYLMMRGTGHEKSPTSLYVESITINKYKTQDSAFALVSFESKRPIGLSKEEAAKNSVELSLYCTLPGVKESEFETLTLAFFDKNVNGLFKYSLPQYIEI